MKDRIKPSKMSAVLWTILAILATVSAIKGFSGRSETNDRTGDIVMFLLFVLPYTYIAVLWWRMYFKAKSKNGVKETKTE